MALKRKPFDIRIEGLKETLESLNKFVDEADVGVRKGLIRAGFFIQRASQKKTPVDFGNLKASAYTAWSKKTKYKNPKNKVKTKPPKMKLSHPQFTKSGEGARVSREYQPEVLEAVQRTKKKYPCVEVGHTAYYAIYVHEIKENKHNPPGEYKFLSILQS